MNYWHIPVLTLLVVTSTTVQAANPPKLGKQVATQNAPLLLAQPRGVAVLSNNEQYQLLPGVRATTSKASEQPQQTLSRVGGNAVIETKGNFVVYTAAAQGASASIAQTGNVTTYPTVLNSRTGGVGILPGTVNVKLKNMGNAAAVASDHGLELLHAFAHLQLASYRVKPGQDVVAAAAKLAADARVASAEVEVLEHMNEPH